MLVRTRTYADALPRRSMRQLRQCSARAFTMRRAACVMLVTIADDYAAYDMMPPIRCYIGLIIFSPLLAVATTPC